MIKMTPAQGKKLESLRNSKGYTQHYMTGNTLVVCFRVKVDGGREIIYANIIGPKGGSTTFYNNVERS